MAKIRARTEPVPVVPRLRRRAAKPGIRWVDRGSVLNDHLANATGSHHRRRPRRLRGGMADRKPAASRWCCTRCGPTRNDRRAQDAGAGRTRLLQFVPLRRSRNQCGRAAARGDAPARLAHHALRRREPGAGRRRARGRSRGICRRRHGGDRGAPADHDLPRGSRPPARRLGQRHRGDRPPHLAGARRFRARPDRRRLARLLRRDRADRASRLDRHVGRLVPVALRQGRPRRLGRRLHQLPDDA